MAGAGAVPGACYELRSTESTGRYMVATRDLEAGEVVLIEDAYAMVVSSDWKEKICHTCFKMIREPDSTRSAESRQVEYKALPIECEECNWTWFCSPECQAAGTHTSFECTWLKNLIAGGADAQSTTWLRLLLAALGARLVEANGTLRPDGVTFAGFRSLVHHRHDMSENVRELFTDIAEWIQELVTGRGLDESFDTLMDFICQAECNGFGKWLDGNSCLGNGVFINSSMFNHACYPNVAHFLEGRHMTHRTLRPVRAGEELSTTYIDLHADRYHRREELLYNYYFPCSCARCEDEDESAPNAETLPHYEQFVRENVCYNAGCHGLVLHTGTERRCSRCFTSDTFDAHTGAKIDSRR